VYRDLDALERAGLPLERTLQNGEARIRLDAEALGSKAWTRDEALALALARAALSPLAGTRLERALAGIARRDEANLPVSVVDRRRPAAAAITAALERAVLDGRRVRARYRSTSDKLPRERELDPVEIRLHEGAAYVVAYDVEADSFKTFKASRFEEVRLLEELTAARARYDRERQHAHAVGVWSGAPVDVTIRLGAAVARFAQEWPLRLDQAVVEEPDGSVLVSARVAGQVETLRWVLGWGRNAEVIRPPSLRNALRDELAAALERYGLSQTADTAVG
jgi:predicted DNA-binding transcriptional regulator YafY